MTDGMRISPADNHHLQFLRRQVDRLEQLRFAKDAPADADHQLSQAREELRKFVDGKRMQGYMI